MPTRRFVLTLLFLLTAGASAGVYAAIASAPAALPAPAAVARIEQGSATIERGNETIPIGARSELLAADRVLASSESRVLITLYDSFDLVLDGGAEVLISELHPSSRVLMLLERGRAYARWSPGIGPAKLYAIEAGAVRFRNEPGKPAQAVVVADDQTRIQPLSGIAGGSLLVWTRDARDGSPKEISSIDSDIVLSVNLSGRAERRRGGRQGDPLSEIFVEDATKLVERREAGTRDASRAALAELAGSGQPPGPGYWLKRLGERVRLALTTDAGKRATLAQQLRQRRFAEFMTYRSEMTARAYRASRTASEIDDLDEACHWYLITRLAAVAECQARTGSADSAAAAFDNLLFSHPPPVLLPPVQAATSTPSLPLTATSTVVQ